ncbi:PepSY-associated TM helix domain-containing protein [Flavobacterium psychrotrophum]|uniref:PepSY-associated TM helix domain-containing protein n=1 Tax=Flavobacterium psychrotrophum TaxID=2294119 RepID=UPI000E317177|nr:PepSY-associated TM helix domain-containing protein [Flavobacterium psychrotrophum]
MTKKKKRDFKHWVGKAHLVLGLASGLIVLLMAVTGCLFAFQEEITNAIRHDVMYVTPGKEQLPATVIWQKTQDALGPDMPLNSITLFNDPEMAVHSYAYKFNEGGFWYFTNLEYYYSVYTNPYTGEVLAMYDEGHNFFNVVKMLHWSLLISHPVGQQIIGWATFIFVAMLISGIILWWPKNKAARKQRLWFQWKDTTKWRRKNYDLHNILGFYASSVGLVLALTGMVWAFTWFQSTVYVVASLSITPPVPLVVKSTIAHADKDKAFNLAAVAVQQKYPEADYYSIGKPADSTAAIGMHVNLVKGTYYKHHHAYFDQYTGKFLAEENYKDDNMGEKVIGANYDIHVGAILGLPGKILAFTASLICSILPVTGFLIWRGRNKKTPKTTPVKK